MPYYFVKGEIREVSRPDLPDRPDWRPETGLPGVPDTGGPGGWPGFPERPGHGLPPMLPPRDEWPELPPFLKPGVGLPIPPSPELPWVPVEPEVDPPGVWPPLPSPPTLPDLSGKSLILARFYVSRYVNFLRWVVIDHEETKGKLQKIKDWLKANMPAGGIGGTPPPRPGGPVPERH